MTRRGFIGRTLSCGALFAASRLPSFADEPTVFPARGDYERLSLTYHAVKAGATAPFTLLHFSDTHLAATYPHEPQDVRENMRRRTVIFGGRQEEALRDTLAWARTNVDFIVHTGDVVDLGTEANFDLVRRYFGGWNVFGCVGNHEFEVGGKSQYGDHDAIIPELAKYYPFDPTFSSRVVNGVNFVALDNAFGGVTERQVALFAKEEEKGLPIILCMHVPFFTPFILTAKMKFAKKTKGFDGKTPAPKRGDHLRQLNDPVTRDFIAHLKAQPLLKAILTGHLHIGLEERFSPTAMQYVVAGNYMFHAAEILIT